MRKRSYGVMLGAVLLGSCSDTVGTSPVISDASTLEEGSAADGSAADAGSLPDTSLPPKVAACDNLPAVGTFEDITPPDVRTAINAAKGTTMADYTGTFAIAADPVNQGTLYAGTSSEKVWKSTDCGATWTNISTGTNGAKVNSGRNWTFAVDPASPQTIYTNSGYGANGLFKSNNGGVDWIEIWPPAAQPDLGKAFTYNFANVVALDPLDHKHVLLTFHEQCLPPHPQTCIAETNDSGATWRLIDGDPSWNGNEGQVIFFLGDSTTWLWGSQTNGFWRGTGSGTSWQAIKGMTTSHLQGSQLVHTKTGAYVVAGADGIWRSPDGLATTWQLIPKTGPILGGVVDDGAALYTVNCYFPGFCPAATYFKSVDDGKTWSPMTSPKIDMGGSFAYDPGHSLLFSSNHHAGLWRVKVK